MSWMNEFSDILADYYGNKYDRLSARAGLKNIETINKQRGEIDVWFDIVNLARKENRLEQLAGVVMSDYDSLSDELQSILAQARTQQINDAEIGRSQDSPNSLKKNDKSKRLSQANLVAILVAIIGLVGTLLTVFYPDIKDFLSQDPTPIQTAVIKVQITEEADIPEAPEDPEEAEPDIPTYTVAISEVMANPCGIDEETDANWNEYIELYNYGEVDVDIGGWWISDGESAVGNPDQIVAWSERFPGGESTQSGIFKTETTVIPPGNYALILSPQYFLRRGTYALPYLFPDNMILLTIAEGNVLGSDDYGIEVWLILNPVTLYEGSKDQVTKVVSTYGTPNLSGSPSNLKDDGQDNIPLEVYDCYASERISASGPDAEYNWRTKYNGSPGVGSD